MKLRFALLALLATLGPAQSGRMTLLGAGTATSAAAYSGPGDIVSGAKAWWGLRGYNAAFAGNAANVCLPLDVTCADVAIVSGSLSLSALGVLGCNDSTSICTVKTLYDQTGNGNTITQGTIGKRPKLTVSCVSSLPCMTFASASSQTMQTSAAFSDTSQQWSISVVGNRTANFTTAQVFIGDVSSHSAGFSATSGNAQFNAGSTVDATASNTTIHAIQFVANGASSIIYVDGSSTTVNAGAGTFGVDDLVYLGSLGDSSRYLTGSIMEIGVWPSGFTGGNQSSMNSNQHTYWGF